MQDQSVPDKPSRRPSQLRDALDAAQGNWEADNNGTLIVPGPGSWRIRAKKMKVLLRAAIGSIWTFILLTASALVALVIYGVWFDH